MSKLEDSHAIYARAHEIDQKINEFIKANPLDEYTKPNWSLFMRTLETYTNCLRSEYNAYEVRRKKNNC